MRLATALAILMAIHLTAPLVKGENDNDRRHKSGDGTNKDGAAYWGDQKSKSMLTPDMISHYTQSTMYFMTGNFAMGQMEQMKGDMLKQQIDENKKSADKNRQNEKLMTDGNDPLTKQLRVDPGVRTVDRERAAAKLQAAAGASDSIVPYTAPLNGTIPPPGDAASPGAPPEAALPPPPPAPPAPAAVTTNTDAIFPLNAPPSQTARSASRGASGQAAAGASDSIVPYTAPLTAGEGAPSSAPAADATPDWKKDLDSITNQANAPAPSAPEVPGAFVSLELPRQRLIGAATKVFGAEASEEQKKKAHKEEEAFFATVGRDPRAAQTAVKSPRGAARKRRSLARGPDYSQD